MFKSGIQQKVNGDGYSKTANNKIALITNSQIMFQKIQSDSVQSISGNKK